jgi:hypothetical protein
MDTDPHIVPTSIAVAVITVTALWVLLLHVRTKPRRPSVGAVTMELGPEPPAVVDLLTDDFTVTARAVPATLVDLAARRWLTIEQVGGDSVVLRVPARDRGEPLAPYERRVLDHVRGLSIDGVVPAAAMTTGPETASRRWWRLFRREVIADAQARGLSRDRWTRTTLVPVWGGVVAAGLMLWLADQRGRTSDDVASPSGVAVVWGLTFVATVALGLWAATLLERDLQRDTDAGLAAASRWTGVREYMATVGDFEEKPAAMVALWDRYLAHAVALDLAPRVVAELPLGAEDHRHAWSRASGRWRQIRVRYPAMRPGYGQHPALALIGAAAADVVAAVVIGVVDRVRHDEIEILADLPTDIGRWIDSATIVIGAAMVLVLCWNAVKLVFALADLLATDQKVGVLVRTRVRTGWVGLSAERTRSSEDRAKERFFCALDTGDDPVITAWRIRRKIYDQISQGDRCSVRLTRRLRYVRGIEVIPP